MALDFVRRAQPGGDLGSWSSFEQAQNEAVLGALTGRLYNDGGTLKLPACLIGINDGSNVGVVKNTTAASISLAGVSNSNWIAIELSVSGTAGTLTATDIAGATDPTIIPASVRAAYNGLKGGFYLAATKRLLGLAWLNGAGVLLAVVNFDGQKIWASQIGLHTGTIHNQYEPEKGFILPTGIWDMDATTNLNVLHSFGIFFTAIQRCDGIVRSDNGVYMQPLMTNQGVGLLTSAGGILQITSILIMLTRVATSLFDSTDYNDAAINRGYVNVKMREF